MYGRATWIRRTSHSATFLCRPSVTGSMRRARAGAPDVPEPCRRRASDFCDTPEPAGPTVHRSLPATTAPVRRCALAHRHGDTHDRTFTRVRTRPGSHVGRRHGDGVGRSAAGRRRTAPRVGVVGGTGYTGALTAELILRHPRADLVAISSEASAGTCRQRVQSPPAHRARTSVARPRSAASTSPSSARLTAQAAGVARAPARRRRQGDRPVGRLPARRRRRTRSGTATTPFPRCCPASTG